MNRRGRAGLPWLPSDLDPRRPSVARVYDFYLGGSHNFESDRRFGRQVLEKMPTASVIARENRTFLHRAVLHLCEQGIDQFLDLGSGLPTACNVHEVAQSVNPQARVVYVDHDPAVVAPGTDLLQDNPTATLLLEDMRHPDEVLAAVAQSGVLDLDRPVGVLMVAVLHFIPDDQRPREMVARYMAACAPGSALAAAHARSDGQAQIRVAARLYDDDAASPSRTMQLRTKNEFQLLFADVTLEEPGVVPAPRWHPEIGTAEPIDPAKVPDDHPILAGVGRKV